MYARVGTIKKAERWKIDAFELWYWRRLLRVPWTARRSNQSILKEISHEYSLEGLMLRLKLQYFGDLMWRTDTCKSAPCWSSISLLCTPVGYRESGRRHFRRWWSHTVKVTQVPDWPGGRFYIRKEHHIELHLDRGAWWATVHGVTRSQTWMSD